MLLRRFLTLGALALTIAAGTACSGTWGGPARRTTADRLITAGYVASTALVACDVAGTVWMSHGGAYDRAGRTPGTLMAEVNPVLGQEPMPGLLVAIAVGTAISGYLVHESPLPRWAKGAWFGALTAAEAWTVARNARLVGACGVGGYEGGFLAEEAR